MAALAALTVGAIPRAQDAEAAIRAAFEAIPQESVPAAMLVVVHGNEVVFSGVRGVLEPGGETAVDEASSFAMGFVSRVILARVIDELLESKRLDWDAPVNDYLPGTRQLVNGRRTPSSATLGDLYSGKVKFNGYRNLLPLELTAQWPLERVLRDHGEADENGRRVSPRGQVLRSAYLQAVVESATKGPWSKAVHDLVSAPLGLTDLHVAGSANFPVSHVRCVSVDPKGEVRVDRNVHTSVPASAGVWISLRDARFLMVDLLARARSVGGGGLDLESLRALPPFYEFGRIDDPHVGLVLDARGLPGTPGVCASLRVYPRHDVAWFYLASAGAWTDDQAALQRELGRLMLPPVPEREPGAPWQSHVPPSNDRGWPGHKGDWEAALSCGDERVQLVLTFGRREVQGLTVGGVTYPAQKEESSPRRMYARFDNPLPVRRDVDSKCDLNMRFDRESRTFVGTLSLVGRYVWIQWPVEFRRPPK